MQGDAIQSALKASEQALYDLEMVDGEAFAGVVLQSIYCHAGSLPENLEIVRAILRQVSATAIATFLRALPNEALDSVPDVGFMDAVACRNAWAAAVSRAPSAAMTEEGDSDG